MPPTPRQPLQGPPSVDARNGDGGKHHTDSYNQAPRQMPYNNSSRSFGGFPPIMPMMPMLGFGNYGSGMNGPGGGGGGFMDNAFMRGLYVLNSSMFTLSQLFMVMSLNTQSLYGMYLAIKGAYAKLVDMMSNSETIKWLRMKTKKSLVLRWAIVILVAYLSTSAYWLLKRLVITEYEKLMVGR